MDDKFLQTAQFLGLECAAQSGEEVACTCPFCDKEQHFYWNVAKSVGHCKRCDTGTNRMGLLSALWDNADDGMTPGRMAQLARDRRLPIEAFTGYGIKYIEDRYIIPVLGFDGKLVSLRDYQPLRTLRIMAGCPAALFGAERLSDKTRQNENVFICEGEWDAIAFHYYLRTMKFPGVVVAVPGAGTFKPEWISAFAGRKVHLGYDNDEAGRNGMYKVAEMLVHHVSTLAVIIWRQGLPSGYDIRDLIINKLKLMK